MANCNHLLWLDWATIIPKIKLIADAYMRAHACAYNISGMGGFELVLFAPLGKSFLALMSCSADMNGKTLNLSKQEYCEVWGEAL